MTVVQRYATGMDINFQETYLFDSVGDLAEYRKRGFGGQNITKYPLPQLDPQKRYDFDYDGDILRVMEFDMKGRLASSTHYIYGSGGNLVQTVSYAYNEADSGVVMERTVTLYDKHERPVSINTYTPAAATTPSDASHTTTKNRPSSASSAAATPTTATAIGPAAATRLTARRYTPSKEK